MKNMKMKLALGGVAVGVLALAGCASQNVGNIENGYMTNVTGKTYPATQAQNIKVIYKNQPNQDLPCKKYSTIGQITVDTYGPYVGITRGAGKVSELFRKAGSKLGADAIINITEADQTDVGYAIKCNK
jgi:hypothetical protein|tara:strand:- start:40332 stop:40718 length:387 start_codon:yes stop_codon:yes gene_type:complete